MHDVLRLAFPELIMSDEDHYFDLSVSACRYDISLGERCSFSLADLLGRVTMLSNPVKSELNGKLYHCLGEVSIIDDYVNMTSAVRRDADG